MIKDKLDLLTKQIYENNNKSKKKALIALLGAVAFGSFGIVTTIFSPITGIPALLTSLGLGMTARNIEKKRKKKEARIMQEKLHLKRLEQKGLDISKDVSNKRVNKVIELRNTKTEKTTKRERLAIANYISLAGLAASTIVATIAAPTIGLIGGIASGIIKLSTDLLISKSDSEIETLKNRINNLNNDLDVIRNRVKTVPFRNSDVKTKEAVAAPKKAEEVKTDNKSAEAVEEFIEKIATDLEEEKPVQKVK